MYVKPIEGFEDYYISRDGCVFRRTRKGDLRLITVSVEKKCGFSRVNMESRDGKWGTYLLHRLVYSTFKRKTKRDIVFIDGNKQNCNLDNLITVEELLEFYKKNRKTS